MNTNRRTFIKQTAQTAALLPFTSFAVFAEPNDELHGPLSVHIFSKHLQFLDFSEMGAIAAEMEFAGIDLTVRPNGHVEPESVKTVLPKAVKLIRDAGSDCRMMATTIESVKNPLDVDVITTAAASGLKYYRANWFKYPSQSSMSDALVMYARQIKELSLFNKSVGIIGCYQNHAGKNVGSSFWEIKRILQDADPEYFGTQYDIRHAMVEGGFSWENGLSLLLPHIKVIVVKDYCWEKVNGVWTLVNTPIGEGMVPFTKYFSILKKAGLKPPVSLHCEYDLGGAQKGDKTITVDKKVVFYSMKKDLRTIQKLWDQA